MRVRGTAMLRFRALRQLHAADYLDALRAAGDLIRVGAGLRLRALPDLLERWNLDGGAPQAGEEELARAQQAVRRAHRLVPLGANCLRDSLAAALWLRRRGRSVPLVIGVRNGKGAVEAHAWLEGNAPANEHYQVLWRSKACRQ